MDEQPRRIECTSCKHTLRLENDESYRHSGPRGASCECPCQGLALEHIKQWRALGQPKTSAPGNSSPPAGVKPPKSSEAPPPVSPPAPPDVAPAVGVPAPTQAATIPPVAAPVEEPATPELELPDGRLFSNSEFQTWKRCQRKWWLAYYRRLRPLHEGAIGPRSIGIRVHLALAALYAGRADPLDVIRTSVAEDLATNPDLEIGLLKDEQMALAMVEGYLQWVQETGADEGLKFLADEATLIAPMSLPDTYFIGRLDARFEREMDHARLFMDHKALRNGTPVLTPTGWVPIEDLTVGAEVLTPDGTTTHVTGVYPQGEVDLHRVTFTDKSFVDCCGDHLWFLHHKWRQATEVRALRDVAPLRTPEGRGHLWRVPTVTPGKMNFAATALPLDPYVLGVWLGDGTYNTAGFSSADPELAERVRSRLPDGMTLSYDGNIGYFIHGKRSQSFQALLRQLGVLQCHSWDKHVPSQYLWASAHDRLELLRGLMDTDGCVRTKTKQIVFGSASEQLRDDVCHLVRSLGGGVTPNYFATTSYKWEGKVHIGRPCHVASITMPFDLSPFALSRKHELFVSKSRTPAKRFITKIEPASRDHAVCISVADPAQLYVTKDFIITHNTVASLTEPVRTLPMNEQMLGYMLLERLDAKFNAPDGSEGEYVAGALYNMLRRVLRTERAKPPFYDRVEVHHSDIELRNYYQRIHGTIRQILQAQTELDAGTTHHYVVPPRPSKDCTWDCDFFVVCPLFDDGSDAEGLLAAYYVEDNPLRRYIEQKKELADA